MSRNIRLYETMNDYENDIYNISNVEFSVSYITDNKSCYFHNKQNKSIIKAKIPQEITIDYIQNNYGGKIPIINRTDLISQIKINGLDYSEYLHKGPEINWVSNDYDLMKEQFESLSYEKNEEGNITGYSDYVISIEATDENLHNEFDFEIQLKDGVTDISFLFYNTFITEINGNFLNKRKNGITTAEGAFSNCKYLTKIPDKLFNNCINLYNINSIFENCTSLTSIGNYAFANCYELTEINNSFKQCNNIIEIGDYAFSECRNIKDVSVLLLGSKNIQKIGNYAFKNCISLTNISGLFIGCSQLIEIGDYLFEGCYSIKTASYTFAECKAIKEITNNIFKDCSNIVDIYGMFSGCTSLSKIGHNIFYDLINLITISELFENCTSLETIDFDIFSKCKNIVNLSYVFNNCTSLIKIPEHLFDENNAVTTVYGLFNGCVNLQTIPEKLFQYNKNITAFSLCFANCSELTGNVPTDSDGTPIYNRSGEGKNEYAIANYTYSCFKNCTKLNDYSLIPENWK